MWPRPKDTGRPTLLRNQMHLYRHSERCTPQSVAGASLAPLCRREQQGGGMNGGIGLCEILGSQDALSRAMSPVRGARPNRIPSVCGSPLPLLD